MDAEAQYEAQRQANIAANFALLNELGLAAKPKAVKRVEPRIQKPALVVTSRRSPRVRRSKYLHEETKKPLKRTIDMTLRSSSRRRSNRETTGKRQKREGSDSWESDESDLDEYTSDQSYGAVAVKRRRRRPASWLIDNLEPGDSDGDYRESTRPRPSASSTLPLRSTQRLGTRIHDPKRFGHIPGVPVGTWWATRMDCSTDAVHAPTVAGISGNGNDGCWSLALSGGYSDDIDLGNSFTYTGSGGRQLQGYRNGKRLNLRTAPQTFDQSFKDSLNGALLQSSKTGKPIRVIRGYKNDTKWSPLEGYVYSGLYTCTKAWMARGVSGFKVCRYAFHRLPGQDPLPVPERLFDRDTSDRPDITYPTSGVIVEVVITRS